MIDFTTGLTGMLSFILLISAILSAMISFGLLSLYRRAVIRAMNKGSVVEDESPSIKVSASLTGSNQLTLNIVDNMQLVSDDVQSVYRSTSHSLRMLGAVYLLAGLVYAVILSLPWMITADDGFPVMRLLWLMICYAWPAVLSLLFVATSSRRESVFVVSIYTLLLLSIAMLALTRNPDLSTGQLIYIWLFANASGTLLLMAFLVRRIRAVGSLVLAFVVLGVTGAMLTLILSGSSEYILMSVVVIGDQLGLGANALIVLLLVLGFMVFAGLGWWLLSRLGHAYRAKRMSDQSIMLDAIWLLFGVLQSFTLVFEGWGWIITGLIAFAAYKLTTVIGFRKVFTPEDDTTQEFSILLLRVFSLGRRSERLFDQFTQRWLRTGDINLIAGPDLATSTVEPHEFLDFVGGRLSRQFVESEAELLQGLRGRDQRPDPDGRFRVNEFFCRRHTWRMTMQQLAADSHAVLMDLRGFSVENQGCIWELEQLLVGVPLDRIILVVDETTDHAFLKEKINEKWEEIPANSVNRTRSEASLNLFELSSTASQRIDGLVRLTIQACLR